MTTDDAPASREVEATEERPADAAEGHGAEHADQDGPPKKRRRRRRGGRGRKPKAEGAESPEGGAPDGDAEPRPEGGGGGEAAGESGDRPARKRRRRRRGRSGDRDEDRPRRSDDDADAFDDPDADDADPGTPRARRRAPKDADSVENWEEIFEQRSFEDLGLRSSVLKGVEAAGFTNPTKIQAEMIPAVIGGRDVLGQSRTGTGKTAAFGLPLFHGAQREVPFQSIVLAPTRELAIQIAEELADLGRFTPIRVSAVYGGQSISAQAKRLDQGPEIIVATPGRLWDMKNRSYLHFRNVRYAVLDEVDRMLDIGFREDIKQILGAMRTEHQTVFVSATIGDEIEKLAKSFMKDPVRLTTTGSSLTVSLVQQHYITVEPWDKRKMLLHLLTHEDPELTVVFCRMKRTVDDVTKFLKNKGVDAHAIHGDMYQGKRNSVMRRLRSGELGVLVASDLAARGLDVDGVSHVVNYDLPEDPEIYVHRIGRTARAGRDGVAWSLVTPEQGDLLTAIELLANIHIPSKDYPEFEPGPVPSGVRAERAKEAERIESLQSRSRHAAPEAPAQAAVDPKRFPGGVVPTKMPPKTMGGRTRTARSMKGQPPKPPAAG